MRPVFPKRAVVTAGMPYGNKGLHFGHIGGVFVPADCYARFLRDRIGAENVLFVCGTDCFGSPIDEGYRRLVAEEGFSGSIADYVQKNHDAQAATLRAYDISLDIFEGSGIGRSKECHEELTAAFIQRLREQGSLSKESTAQFFDDEAQSFLNGRQVQGRCPVPGCKSENAYADECNLGHQYMPADLIAPVSSLSGTKPSMRDVENWYFDLPGSRGFLSQYAAGLKGDARVRAVVCNTVGEFLSPPIIYVKEEGLAGYLECASAMPEHVYRPVEKGKQSFELEFSDLKDRDAARQLLDASGLRYRTGKALVPFRITGNIEWGVPAPEMEGAGGLTVWCWPESLWAPISFTRAWLSSQGKGIESLNPARPASPGLTWRDFWCSSEAEVYQFIGQDNIYFYGVAQTAMWEKVGACTGVPDGRPDADARTGGDGLDSEPAGDGAGQVACAEPAACAGASFDADTLFSDALSFFGLRQSLLVANYHLQFLGKKASSSGAVRPPMADELLCYYTTEQLRAHFLALGLGLKPVSFQPKPLNPAAGEKDADPVLKEGQLLTNVFNRLARSCFYEAQNNNGGLMPLGEPAEAVREDAENAVLAFEQAMYKTELHAAMQLAGDFIRRSNKYWSDAVKAAGECADKRRQVLVDAFYLLRTATVLMHPIAPQGCEMIVGHLALGDRGKGFFSWEHVFSGYEPFMSAEELEQGAHRLKELPPRTDFFPRHESQF